MPIYKLVTLSGLIGCMIAGTSDAQDSTPEDTLQERNGWSYELGIGVEREPVYTGSDVYTAEPELDVELAYDAPDGHTYYLSLGAVGAEWQLNQKTLFTTELEYELGRDNSEDPALAGFPEVEDTVEAQAVLKHRIGPVIAGLGLQYDILDRGKGLVGFLGLLYPLQINDKLMLLAQIDASFADAEHLRTEVGISPATAAITGYDSFSPEAGFKGLTSSFKLQYQTTRTLSLISEISVESYGSNMTRSPLIADEGADTTYEVFLGIQRSF